MVKNKGVAVEAKTTTVVVTKEGRLFRIVRGVACIFCDGPTFMATLGPGRSQVRVCDSKWVVDEMRGKVKGLESEIKRIIKERDDAVFAGWEFEDVMSKNDSKAARKFLGLKEKTTDEELAEIVATKKLAIEKAISEKEKVVADEIPEEENEIARLERRIARMNEFCLAIMGWRDDRVVKRPEQEFIAA